jgi:type IV pilus assembly protein PilA
LERLCHTQSLTSPLANKKVALIAIAAIAVYQYFGNTVRNQTAAIAKELSGSDGTAAKTAAQTAAATAETEANTKRNLDTYTGNAAK